MVKLRSPHSWPLFVGYFAFCLPTGVLLSYLPLYLHHKGLTPAQVGMTFSVVFGVKLIMGPLMSWWGDFKERQSQVLITLAWLCLVIAICLFFANLFWWLFFLIGLLSFCRSYFQSRLEALAVAETGGNKSLYGRVRSMGSLGVCLGVIAFGGLWSSSVEYQTLALPILIVVSSSLFAYCAVKGVHLEKSSANEFPVSPPHFDRQMLSTREVGRPLLVALLLVGAMLMIGANGVFYSTTTLILQKQGLSPSNITLLWLVTFGIEAFGFVAFDRLQRRWGAPRFFAAVVFLTLIRWSLLAQADDLAVLFVAFVLHVASFSWLHATCAQWVQASFHSKYSTTGQAIYTACAHGIGMALSSYVASALLLNLGQSVFWISFFMTAVGAGFCALRLLLLKPLALPRRNAS